MISDELEALVDHALEVLEAGGCDMHPQGGERWRGLCSLCGDRTLTLQVRLDQTGLFLNCWHATCDPQMICEALGITKDDLRLTKPESGGELVRRSFDMIKLEPVRHLVPERIPEQGVSMVVGDPFVAKSTWTACVAAGVTTGAYGEPGTVAILNAEDATTAITGPRVKAAGAILSRVEELTVNTGEYERVITLPDDVPKLETWVVETRARLLILDPLMMFLTERADANRDHAVRRALASLAMMAERQHLAVLVAAHLNKDEQKRMLYRVGGSIGIVGLARSVLLLTHDPDDPEGEDGDFRLLAHIASNWAKRAPTLRYRIEQVSWEEGGEQITTTKLVTEGESDLTAEQLIAPARGKEPSKVELAEDAICDALAGGVRLSSEVKAEVARTVDCRHATAERAASELRLSQVLGSEGSGRATHWYLLNQPPQTAPKPEEEEVRDQTVSPYIRAHREGEPPPPQPGEKREEVREGVWNGARDGDDRERAKEAFRRVREGA